MTPMLVRLALAAAVALLGSSALADSAEQVGDLNEQGVRIHWRYAPHAQIKGLGTLDVDLADNATGAPLRFGSGKLLAWMQRERAALSSTEPPCDVRVRDLVRAGLGRRADIDLNGYRFVTLNADGSLAVINPFVGLNNAKLESLLPLGGTPVAWTQLPERAEIWVALGEPAELVALDMHSRKKARRLPLPPGKTVREIVAEAGGQGIWLAFSDETDFGFVDLGTGEPRQGLIAATGARRIVAVPALDGTVTLEADGVVALRRHSTILRRWHLAGRAVAAAYSDQARKLIVATEDGTVVWLDPGLEEAQPERRLDLGHSLRDLVLIDGGRRAVGTGNGRASLIDLATGSVLAQLQTPSAGFDLLLTSSFLYAVDPASGRAMLWPLGSLREGRPEPLDVMLGSADPDADPRTTHLARAIAAPEGKGVLFASARDGLIFQFSEGMMAPGGSFSNYRRAALALDVLDQSLRAVGPGRYRATVRHTNGDRYVLALTGVEPRFSACATVDLAPTPESAAPREERLHVVMTDLSSRATTETDRRQVLRVRLESRGSDGAVIPLLGVHDLTLLVFDRLRAWQSRALFRERGNGEYEADIAVPRPARYEAMASSASRNLTFREGRVGEVTLGGGP